MEESGHGSEPPLGFPQACGEGVSYAAFLSVPPGLLWNLAQFTPYTVALKFCQLGFTVRYLGETLALPRYRAVSQTNLYYEHLLLQGSQVW